MHEDLDMQHDLYLRSAFVATLEAKAVLKLAQADLEYCDKIIDISRARFKSGDLAQIDLDRIELQRVQYESEIETAIVNLRTQKILLLQLLDERTPLDQFDVEGRFDFSVDLKTKDEFRNIALANRPDLQAALQTLEQSKTNHKLAESNGSTDPYFRPLVHVQSSNNNPERNPDAGRQRKHSAARLRPQPGRKEKNADRYRPQPGTSRSHAGAGIQRR